MLASSPSCLPPPPPSRRHGCFATQGTRRRALEEVRPRTSLQSGRNKLELIAGQINAELFSLTYGALVVQLIKDYEDYGEVNTQLEKMYAGQHVEGSS